jgi:hypothetical protein
MNGNRATLWAGAAAGGLVILSLASALALQPASEKETGLIPADGVEPLAYGPVHEAFAEPVSFDPQKGLVVSQQPPDPVEEVPPDDKPSADNVVWIPGYWGWDAVRVNFIWVSGTWRAVPPGRQWVPGYWAQVNRGWEWVSGYWADAAAREVEYLPPPPGSLEAGPSSPAPSEDSTWVPGVWVWRQTRYAWRPGFWIRAYLDWVWVPDHYVCSPAGCIFVDGYWDLTLLRRGLLFAPAAIERAAFSRPDFTYTPQVVVNLEVFTDNLFVQPNYFHYCFGDYFDPRFLNAGIYPWFAFHQSHFGYDPIFAQACMTGQRSNSRWQEQVHQQFFQRQQNQAARPPRTAAQAQALGKQTGKTPAKGTTQQPGKKTSQQVVQPLSRMTAQGPAKGQPTRIEHLGREQHAQVIRHVQSVRKVVTERFQVEKKVTAQARAPRPAPEARPIKLPAPRPVIASRPVKALHKEAAPPPRPPAAHAPAAKAPPRPAPRPRPEEILRNIQAHHGKGHGKTQPKKD